MKVLLKILFFVSIVISLTFITPSILSSKTFGQNKADAITQIESAIIKVVDNNSASIVTIVIQKEGTSQNSTEQSTTILDLLLRSFDKFTAYSKVSRNFQKTQNLPDPGENIPSGQGSWNIGSGFIVSKDGLVATSKHVLDDRDAKYFITNKVNNKKYEVTNIYRDPNHELAILKVNNNNLDPVDLGDSNKIKVGQLAIAIGTALGELNDSVTVGFISGLNREIVAGDTMGQKKDKLSNLIQTDAAINFGNSGGPLFDSDGRVIGVNVVAGSGENIGFAIPVNTLKQTMEDYKKASF